jgi:hypothetical protein
MSDRKEVFGLQPCPRASGNITQVQLKLRSYNSRSHIGQNATWAILQDRSGVMLGSHTSGAPSLQQSAGTF